jgi:hypothetical protein
LLKCLEQLWGGEEAKFMNLPRKSSSATVRDLVVEAQTRETSRNFDSTATGHPDAIGFPGVFCDPPVFENTGRKPGLNDNDATRRQVLAKTSQRSDDTIERAQIPDRAEEAHDGIVSVRESELTHVGFEESTARVFLLGNAHEGGIQI